MNNLCLFHLLERLKKNALNFTILNPESIVRCSYTTCTKDAHASFEIDSEYEEFFEQEKSKSFGG